MPPPVAQPVGSYEGVAWSHTTCCELHNAGSPRGCCGCCDRGCGFVAMHVFCLPCSFGVVAEQGANSSCVGCCLGLIAGAAMGSYFFGGPMLPCAVRTRRKMVQRYGIREGCLVSFLHVFCCPIASILQMAMEVEERESLQIQCGGRHEQCTYFQMPPGPPQQAMRD